MMYPQRDCFVHNETTCGSLLKELKKIWDEVGEPDIKRDTMLHEIEQECLEVYRRKLDHARKCKAQLEQAIARSELELAEICSAMGEKPHFSHKHGGRLKKELETITPQLEYARKKKIERRNIFFEVINQLQHISEEIYGSAENIVYKIVVDETDLSMERLEQLKQQLHELQNEKTKRLEQVSKHLDTLNLLCVMLDMDFKHTACEIHPNFGDSKGVKEISNNTMEKLASAVHSLQEIKIQRMLRLQGLATSLLELWILMDTPEEEQEMYQKVISIITASGSDILEPKMLSMKFINHVEEEVLRLEQLRSSKLKELVLRKRLDLDEICRKTHMVAGERSSIDYSIEAIESGAMDTAHLLERIDIHIAKVKEEALSRKEILEKVEKWLAACEEECWLEEYNRDENRYNAGRGTHLNLKRAEKARAMVNKIPAMVELLTSKTTVWEKERGTEFLYDGVRLLSMLEQYSILRKEKEEEKQRHREQKRLKGQLMAEQEAVFGSKPSPSKNGKMSKTSSGSAIDRKLSLGGAKLPNSKPENDSFRFGPKKRSDLTNRKCSLNPQQYGGSALYSGRRNSEIAGHPVRKHLSAPKAHKTESVLIRKPLSPVTSTVPSEANVAKFVKDDRRVQNGTSSSCRKTPTSKKTSIGDEENTTPRTRTMRTMSVPVAATPPSLSHPMLTATTPSTPFASGGNTITKVTEIDYSFEELRAGFIYPKLL